MKDRMCQEAVLILRRLLSCSIWPLSLLSYPLKTIIEYGPEPENWILHNLAHK